MTTVERIRAGWRTLEFALKEIRGADPRTFWSLIALVGLQGVLPAVAIAISSSVINDFALGRVTESTALFLCLEWAGALGLYYLLSPWILFLQSNLADRCVFRVNEAIIRKASAIEELGPFEDPTFHNDLKLIQTQSSHKPLNLVVTIVGLMKDMAISISCLAMLFSSISWIAAIVVVCTYAQCRIFARIQQETWKDSLGRSQDSRRMSYLASLSVQRECAKEVRAYDLGPFLEKEHRIAFSTMNARVVAFRLKQVARSYVPLIFTLLGSFFVFFYVVRSALHGEVSLGTIALLLQSLAQLHLSVGSFSEQFGWMSGHLLFFKKYREFLRSSAGMVTPRPPPRHSLRLKTAPPPVSRIQNISFSYPNGLQALTDVSLDIEAGQRIALVGANGSGKSTLIKLLCGFYRAERGSILINGTPLETLPLTKWRADISAVFQDFHQYALTLRQNVVMGDAAPSQQLSRVLEQLDLDLNSEQLLDQTFGGTDLSKGQWQRVAIARALYRNAPLYILDEPNSFLDPHSEAEIFTQFAALPSDKTVIFVTHRLGSVKLADQIVLLEDGRIADAGTHHELLGRSPLYHSLYTAQASQYVSDTPASPGDPRGIRPLPPAGPTAVKTPSAPMSDIALAASYAEVGRGYQLQSADEGAIAANSAMVTEIQ